MKTRERKLFDVWANMSYACYQWEKGVIDSAELAETLQNSLRELKELALEVTS